MLNLTNLVSGFLPSKKIPVTPAEYLAAYKAATIKPSCAQQLESIAQRVKANWAKYAKCSDATGLPAHLIAGLHYRESNMNFHTFMHNGDPLFDSHGTPLKTIHVPRGKGPFATWEESAADALGKHTGLTGIGECLAYAERFNGMGYRRRGIGSPYVWSGLDNSPYKSGKYVADGVFSASTIDKQMGVAAIFKALGI